MLQRASPASALGRTQTLASSNTFFEASSGASPLYRKLSARSDHISAANASPFHFALFQTLTSRRSCFVERFVQKSNFSSKRTPLSRRRLTLTLGHMAKSSLSAVCFRCGASKRYAPNACSTCGFKPVAAFDLAKSFILSKQFDVGEVIVGRSVKELSQISTQISHGLPYNFDPAEISRVQESVFAFKVITPGKLAADLLKWAGPPLLILAIVFALLSR